MKRSEIRELRALSVCQPWAHAIVFNGKNVENRSRITHCRGTIAIHASQTMYLDDFERLKSGYRINLDPYSEDVAAMAVIGFANIVDVIDKKSVGTKTKKWFQGTYGYVLDNVVALKDPVEVKGALGFWRLTGAPLRKCIEQISDAQIRQFVPFGRP